MLQHYVYVLLHKLHKAKSSTKVRESVEVTVCNVGLNMLFQQLTKATVVKYLNNTRSIYIYKKNCKGFKFRVLP